MLYFFGFAEFIALALQTLNIKYDNYFFCQEGNPAPNLKHNSVVFMWCERACVYMTIY